MSNVFHFYRFQLQLYPTGLPIILPIAASNTTTSQISLRVEYLTPTYSVRTYFTLKFDEKSSL